MSRGFGDVEGQISDVGRFASRLRHGKGPLRWIVLLLFVVPLMIAVGLGVAEVIGQLL